MKHLLVNLIRKNSPKGARMIQKNYVFHIRSKLWYQ